MSNMWQHQETGMNNMLAHPDYALLFEQGTGKTRTTIEALRRLYADAGRVRKTLIICPVIVCPNWSAEILKYSKIRANDIVVLTESGAKRVTKFTRAVGDDLSGNKIVITNPEAMQMDTLHKLLQLWGPEILIVDESQRFKSPSSKRAKKLVTISDLAERRYILTGTPILQSAMDIFMQWRILDKGATFGQNFYSFRGRYFVDANSSFKGKQSYFPKWEPNPFTYSNLVDNVAKKSMRVLKKDCLDLPPLVRQEIVVPMGPTQAKAYKEMYRDFITFVETKEGPKAVVAQLAITKALRLQQIVSGFAKDENGNIVRFDTPRMTALSELLSDLCPHNKVIVWAAFKENYAMIAEVCSSLGLKYVELHGEVSHSDRADNLDAFRQDPSVSVLIANQGAGGVGINLVEASYSVYYSKSFRLEDDLQSEARNYRGGSEVHDKVTRIDLVTPGSIDELINESLANKKKVGDDILTYRE